MKRMEIEISKLDRIEYGKVKARLEGDFDHWHFEALVKEGELIELTVKDKRGSKRPCHWRGNLIPKFGEADRWDFLRQLGEFIKELQKMKGEEDGEIIG